MSKDENSLTAWGDEQTKYFYELTPNKVLDAVETFGYRCTGRCNALNSMENRVYEVEIEVEDPKLLKNRSEQFRIVKFYRPGRWSKEQILEEHMFLHDLTEIEIPVVAPLRNSHGSTIYQEPGNGIYCAVFPKVGGRNPQELSNEQLSIVGRLLARMHNAGEIKKADNRVEISCETYGLQSLDFLLESESIPEHLEQRYSDLVQEICEIASPWFSEAERQRIHGDCHLGNLLWGNEGPFWVDFDDMLNGPCVQDIWLILPGRDEHAQEQLDVLLEAYDQMRSFDRSTLCLIEPLRSLRMIHFDAWIAKRWEDPAFPRTFVEFGTDKYWHEQIVQLQEQLAIIEGL